MNLGDMGLCVHAGPLAAFGFDRRYGVIGAQSGLSAHRSELGEDNNHIRRMRGPTDVTDVAASS